MFGFTRSCISTCSLLNHMRGACRPRVEDSGAYGSCRRTSCDENAVLALLILFPFRIAFFDGYQDRSISSRPLSIPAPANPRTIAVARSIDIEQQRLETGGENGRCSCAGVMGARKRSPERLSPEPFLNTLRLQMGRTIQEWSSVSSQPATAAAPTGKIGVTSAIPEDTACNIERTHPIGRVIMNPKSDARSQTHELPTPCTLESPDDNASISRHHQPLNSARTCPVVWMSDKSEVRPASEAFVVGGASTSTAGKSSEDGSKTTRWCDFKILGGCRRQLAVATQYLNNSLFSPTPPESSLPFRPATAAATEAPPYRRGFAAGHGWGGRRPRTTESAASSQMSFAEGYEETRRSPPLDRAHHRSLRTTTALSSRPLTAVANASAAPPGHRVASMRQRLRRSPVAALLRGSGPGERSGLGSEKDMRKQSRATMHLAWAAESCSLPEEAGYTISSPSRPTQVTVAKEERGRGGKGRGRKAILASEPPPESLGAAQQRVVSGAVVAIPKLLLDRIERDSCMSSPNSSHHNQRIMLVHTGGASDQLQQPEQRSTCSKVHKQRRPWSAPAEREPVHDTSSHSVGFSFPQTEDYTAFIRARPGESGHSEQQELKDSRTTLHPTECAGPASDARGSRLTGSTRRNLIEDSLAESDWAEGKGREDEETWRRAQARARGGRGAGDRLRGAEDELYKCSQTSAEAFAGDHSPSMKVHYRPGNRAVQSSRSAAPQQRRGSVRPSSARKRTREQCNDLGTGVTKREFDNWARGDAARGEKWMLPTRDEIVTWGREIDRALRKRVGQTEGDAMLAVNGQERFVEGGIFLHGGAARPGEFDARIVRD